MKPVEIEVKAIGVGVMARQAALIRDGYAALAEKLAEALRVQMSYCATCGGELVEDEDRSSERAVFKRCSCCNEAYMFRREEV